MKKQEEEAVVVEEEEEEEEHMRTATVSPGLVVLNVNLSESVVFAAPRLLLPLPCLCLAYLSTSLPRVLCQASRLWRLSRRCGGSFARSGSAQTSGPNMIATGRQSKRRNSSNERAS